jgi:hypothetical protein
MPRSQTSCAAAQTDSVLRSTSCASGAGDDPRPTGRASELRPDVDRGVGDFLLLARPPMDLRTLELFADEVASTLRAQAQAGAGS